MNIKRTIATTGAVFAVLGLAACGPADESSEQALPAAQETFQPVALEPVTEAPPVTTVEPVATLVPAPEPEPEPVVAPEPVDAPSGPKQPQTDAERAGVPSEAWPEVHDENGNVALEEGESGAPLESDEDLADMTEDELRESGWLTPEMDESDLYGTDNQ